MSDLGQWRNSIQRHLARHRNITNLGIKPTDLVLDLASGQDPQPRANVLCDKFVVDSSERAGGAGIVIDRPFVVADATATPFADKAFDFVYCSHLLEHMEQPRALLGELQRIGKRGYIETPSKIYEKLWGWEFHRWFVTVDANRLVLQGKDKVIFDDDLHNWFSAHIKSKAMWEFIMTRLKELELLTILVWDGEIAYEIHGEALPDTQTFVQSKLDHAHAVEQTAAALAKQRLNKSQKVKQALGRRARGDSDRRVGEIMDHLVCPTCHAPARKVNDYWQCADCGIEYPIVRRVPMMLPEMSRPLPASSSTNIEPQRRRDVEKLEVQPGVNAA